MRARLFWLNDKQWACIAPHPPTNLTGPERDDDRRISGIIHMLQVRRPLARLPARVFLLSARLIPLRSSVLASTASDCRHC
jgi:transposase